MWRGALEDNLVDAARNFFNFDYPINISVAYKDHFESYVFGTYQGNDNAVNTYFNNFDALINFTDSFKESAVELIIKAENNRVMLPTDFQPKQLKILDSLSSELTVAGNNGVVSLTMKEMEVLRILRRNLTTKEIATTLKKSPRQ